MLANLEGVEICLLGYVVFQGMNRGTSGNFWAQGHAMPLVCGILGSEG